MHKSRTHDHGFTSARQGCDWYTFHCSIAQSIAGDFHELSGADSIAALHGIGEAMALNVASKDQFSLGAIGDIEASMDSVMSQAVAFISAAYGKVVESCKSMTECRLKLWKLKTGKSKLWTLSRRMKRFFLNSVKNIPLASSNLAKYNRWLSTCNGPMWLWLGAWPPSGDDPTYCIYWNRSAPRSILKMIRCNWKRSSCHSAHGAGKFYLLKNWMYYILSLCGWGILQKPSNTWHDWLKVIKPRLVLQICMTMLYNKTYKYFTFILPFLSFLNILYRFFPLMSDFGIVRYFNSS